ncbi:hypothetical protein GGQ87_001164 [Brevundimonas alba]|uniref:Uncharacterized protein n=1 Tax=Brevundimonas alba TaxID=74314 RepID=A0A7X5YKI4_9CAUL|nr:hypothetical protein [Brevundimonas alba]NJC40906.1 hypothetical protein [Brevundimonas alba]
MTREDWIWYGAAALSLLWAALALASGGSALFPGLGLCLSLICAASPQARSRVEGWIAVLFSGPLWRSVLIVVGAMMLIQLLPVELALLAAGDVLAYVEVVAAVSVIAANTRLRPLAQAMKLRIETAVVRLRAGLRGGRQTRVRPSRPGRAPPAADDDGRGWACA